VSDLRELYQEVILDHSRKPRNFREIEGPDGQAEGYNPLCGDRGTVTLRLSGDRVADVAYKGAGCSISTASASMMTEAVKGKSRAEAELLFDRFHALITSSPDKSSALGEALGKLAVFSGVCEFPVRVKCAALPWHTLRAALHGEGKPVSTETSEPSSDLKEGR
jgi:nitrogen fixation protein NifU and related proteins